MSILNATLAPWGWLAIKTRGSLLSNGKKDTRSFPSRAGLVHSLEASHHRIPVHYLGGGGLGERGCDVHRRPSLRVPHACQTHLVVDNKLAPMPLKRMSDQFPYLKTTAVFVTSPTPSIRRGLNRWPHPLVCAHVVPLGVSSEVGWANGVNRPGHLTKDTRCLFQGV